MLPMCGVLKKRITSIINLSMPISKLWRMLILLALRKGMLGMIMRCNLEIQRSPSFWKWPLFTKLMFWSQDSMDGKESKRTQQLWEQLFSICQLTRRYQLWLSKTLTPENRDLKDIDTQSVWTVLNNLWKPLGLRPNLNLSKTISQSSYANKITSTQHSSKNQLSTISKN